jgi:hypothetical protein
MLEHLTSTLAGAEHVYLAVRTKSGPHVTPELFTTSGGQIVCLTSAVTLKAKLLRRDPVVGLAAFGGTGAAIAAGTATVVDPASPATIADAPLAAVAAPLGVARFVRDNVAELSGAALDALVGRLGRPLPPHRVLVAVVPTAVAVLEVHELTVSEGWTSSPPAPDDDDHDDEGLDVDALPDDVQRLVRTGDAVVGWLTDDGAPLALPVRWDADDGVATVPSALFEACGAAPRSPACVTLDTWTGYGPSGKQGVMLRGDGVARTEDAVTRLVLDATRATRWDGVETETTDL